MFESSFYAKGYSVTIKRNMLGKTGAILIVGILLFTPVSIMPCQKVNLSPDTCCCESSCQLSQSLDTKEHQCPCQIGESQPVEGSPAVLISNHEKTPKSLSLASEIREPVESLFAQFSGLYQNDFLLLNRDPPLFLLNSSFLI